MGVVALDKEEPTQKPVCSCPVKLPMEFYPLAPSIAVLSARADLLQDFFPVVL